MFPYAASAIDLADLIVELLQHKYEVLIRPTDDNCVMVTVVSLTRPSGLQKVTAVAPKLLDALRLAVAEFGPHALNEGATT